MIDKGLHSIPDTNSLYEGEIIIPEYVEMADGECLPVTSINDAAFAGSRITSLALPPSISKIGTYAFYGLSIGEIQNLENTQVDTIPMYMCSYGKFDRVVLPPTVKVIRTESFRNCNINELIFGGDIDEIEWGGYSIFVGAFANSKIGKLDMGERVGDIGSSAFNYAHIDEIIWPKYIRSIDHHAFECCHIPCVVFPDGIEHIKCSFIEIKGLEYMVSLSPDPSSINVNKNNFLYYSYTDDPITLYVPDGSVDLYSTTDPWSAFPVIKPLTALGIDEAKIDSFSVSAGIYDLQGRKVDAPARGLYIIDGRKTLLR